MYTDVLVVPHWQHMFPQFLNGYSRKCHIASVGYPIEPSCCYMSYNEHLGSLLSHRNKNIDLFNNMQLTYLVTYSITYFLPFFLTSLLTNNLLYFQMYLRAYSDIYLHM